MRSLKFGMFLPKLKLNWKFPIQRILVRYRKPEGPQFMMTDASIDLEKCFKVITTLVDEAGRIISKHASERKSYVTKQNDIDLVTETDKQVESLLVSELRKQFPTHQFICEEFVSKSKEPAKLTPNPTWVIDPVDGTMNFVHNFPFSCISVGFVVEQVTELAIVYNPVQNLRFVARRGHGAFFNGQPIQVSGEKNLGRALITSEFGTSRHFDQLKVVIRNFEKIASKAHGIRCLGSAALNMCYVAMGVADAYYEFGIHAWDICAAALIVREAGGVVLDPAGGELDLMSRRCLACATPELAQSMTVILTQFYPQPRDD